MYIEHRNLTPIEVTVDAFFDNLMLWTANKRYARKFGHLARITQKLEYDNKR